MTFLLLMIAVACFWFGWVGFCITRGYHSLNREQLTGRIKYGALELYEIGNPFSSYTGRSN